MKTKKTTSNLRFCKILTLPAGVFAVIALASHAQAQQTPAPRQQQPQTAPSANAEPTTPQQGTAGTAQIQSQLEAVNQKLAVAQQVAMAQPEVQKEQSAYQETITELIVKEEPPLQEAVEKHKALVSELRSSPELQKPAEERSEDFQAKVVKYQNIEQTLAPKRSQAKTTPEAQEQLKKTREVLMAAMTKVEPATPQLIDQRNALMAQLQQTQR